MKSARQHLLTFRRSDLELFAKLSHDRNPAHLDANYARRTAFGQCLVYGVLGAMGAIREPLKGAPLRLRRLSARFKRPLFVDVPYTVTIDVRRHGGLAVSLGKGGVERLELEVEYEVGGAPWSATGELSSPGYAPRAEAVDVPGTDLVGRELAGEYELATALLPELKKDFGFQYSFIPLSQLTALLWTSYFVGMEMPGRQALFLSCALDFAKVEGTPPARLGYAARVTSFDAETSTLAVAAELSTTQGPVATVELAAARRPPPVEYLLGRLRESLSERVGTSGALENKVGLITGSGRGLGSQLALGCALQGADVVIHGREGRDEAEHVARQVASLGRRAVVVLGDLQERETWSRMNEAVASLGRGLDLFVNNAFPPLVPAAFTELSEDDLERTLRVVSATATGLQTILPAVVESRGMVVNISSEATLNPPREFSQYVMAKSAIEGLILCLSREYGAVRFLNVRPPRLLTDMTNGLVGAFQGRPVEGVVATIVRAIGERRDGPNYRVVDRFD